VEGWSFVSTRKTSRKVGSGATAQYRGKAASACETAVLQLKVSNTVSFLSSLIVPQGGESGCHSNVAMMQSTDNRNRNQATRSSHRFRLGKGVRCIAV
jgi:hypothetical protein